MYFVFLHSLMLNLNSSRNRYSCCSQAWLIAHIHSLYDIIEREYLATASYMNGDVPGLGDALLFSHAVIVLSGHYAVESLSLPTSLKKHFYNIRDTFFRASTSKYQVCYAAHVFIC